VLLAWVNDKNMKLVRNAEQTYENVGIWNGKNRRKWQEGQRE
jgi:hypothetical protein